MGDPLWCLCGLEKTGADSTLYDGVLLSEHNDPVTNLHNITRIPVTRHVASVRHRACLHLSSVQPTII